MQVMTAPKLIPARELLKNHRYILAGGLIVLMLAWARLVPFLEVSHVVALIPLCLLLAGLVLLSPPVGAAFFFLGNYYFGNLTILYYPSVSFLSVLAVVLVATMVYVRWRRGELGGFLRLPRQAYLAVASLALFFFIGYTRAVWQLHFIEIEQTGPHLLTRLFDGGMRGSNELSHYMLLSHWLAFLAIGMFACASYDEFKAFFLSLSILFVVQLLSIPLSYYPEFFHAIYVECRPLGLSFAQVNRAHLGYMAALAGALAMTLAHEGKNPGRAAWLFWWAILSLMVLLSGSRGPVIAWILVTLFVVWRNWRIARNSYLILFAALLSVAAIPGVSLLPCGTVEKLTQARHSVETRIAHVTNLFSPYFEMLADDIAPLLSTTEPRGPGEMAPLLGTTKNVHAKPGYTDGGVMTWLFGKGFGGSLRSVDAKSGQMRTHAGTHNLALDLLAETGLIGLSFFVASITLLWYGLQKSVTHQLHPDSRWLITGLISVMLVLLVKASVAATTPDEDLVGLAIGLLIGAMGVVAARRP